MYQYYAAFAHKRMRAARAGDRGSFITAAGTVLGCIALADGEMQPAELRLIREAYEKAGFADADLSALGRVLRQCADEFSATLFEHERLYARLRLACSEFAGLSNEGMRLELFKTAVRVARADGHATPGELNALRACGTWLNIPEEVQRNAWGS